MTAHAVCLGLTIEQTRLKEDASDEEFERYDVLINFFFSVSVSEFVTRRYSIKRCV